MQYTQALTFYVEIYGNVGTPNQNRSHFVHSIRKVLDGIAEIIDSMPVELRVDLEAATSYVSRTSATLHLFAYQVGF